MSEKISIEFENKHGRRFAIDRVVEPYAAALSNAPMMSIRIGFESIRMLRALLGEMLRQLEIAEVAGMEYPDDAQGLAEAGYRIVK